LRELHQGVALGCQQESVHRRRQLLHVHLVLILHVLGINA
jgi:hypothetical protein